jgi:SET domain
MFIACEVRESQIFGKGLFVTEPVSKGKIICFFSTGASVITEPEFLHAVRTGDHAIIRTGTRHAGKFFTHGNAQEPYTFLNHSFTPNLLCHCGMVLTRRDIAVGEELTVDYRTLVDDTDEGIYSDAASGIEIRGFSARQTLLKTARELIEILEGTNGWMG